MKRPDLRSLNLALCLTLFASITSFAQPEKITLRIVPEPNQTVRMRMIQDMDMDMSFEGEAPQAAPPPGSMKLIAKNVFALTMKVGELDKEGHFTSELTYDEVSSQMTMNGQPMPHADSTGKFIGKKILTTFNKQGEMVDIKIPADLGVSEEAFKKLLKSLYGDLPQTPIGVGEVATAPLDFTVPLPVPGAPPLKIDGQMNFKLISVEKDATGRIAKFDQTVDGKMFSNLEVPGPAGQVKMSLDFKLNGGGDLMMNVDKGVMKLSDTKMTFGGKIKMAAESSEGKLSTINFQGTVKVAVTGE